MLFLEDMTKCKGKPYALCGFCPGYAQSKLFIYKFIISQIKDISIKKLIQFKQYVCHNGCRCYLWKFSKRCLVPLTFGFLIPFLPILRLEDWSIKILYGHTPFWLVGHVSLYLD